MHAHIRRFACRLLDLAVLVIACAAGFAGAAPFAYVAQFESNSVSVVDLATQSIVASIPVGRGPIAVYANAAGTRVYVGNVTSSTISVIDTGTRAVVSTISTALTPGLIAVNPAGTRLAVGFPGTNSAPGNTVGMYDTSTGALVGTISVGSSPAALSFNGTGTRLYVANNVANSISVIDAASLATIATIAVQDPFLMAINPAGTRLYVTSPEVNPNFAVIDLAANSVITRLSLGGTAAALAVNPAGTRVYVGNDDGFISVIDAGSNSVAGTIQTGGHPISVGVTPDGARVIGIDGDSGWLRAYDAATFTQQFSVTLARTAVAWGNFVVGAATTVTPNLPGARSGLWWNPNESGWGIHFTQRGNIIFAAWYTYDASGGPKWYVASSCVVSGNGCSGALYQVARTSGFFGVPFNPSSTLVSTAGSLSVDFSGNDAATMTYTVGGQSRTLPISRQVFRASGATPTVNYTDLWWNPSESGWGMAITQQFGTMFLAWFVYNGSGQPVWYVASDCAATAAGNGCSGTLYRTTGPAFGPTFNPAQVSVFPVGSATLTFSDANNGTLSYTVDGVAATKSITRQIF